MSSKEIEPKPTKAENWLNVTTNLTLARIEQYRELGNEDAFKEDFFAPQLAVLDYLREKLAESDPSTEVFLNDLEDLAIDRGDTDANYFLIHVKQLDMLAGIVGEFPRS